MKSVPVEYYERLKHLIYFKDGKPYWKVDNHKMKKGDLAGGLSCTGYRQIRSRGKFVLAHRLHWYIIHGNLPDCLDHINRNKDDNRIENLRIASRSQNVINVGVKANNTSGVTGVYKNGKGWLANIVFNKKRTTKTFKKKEDAINWRREKEIEFYGEFAPKI